MLSNAMYREKSRHTLTVFNVLYRNNAFSQNMDILRGKRQVRVCQKAERLVRFMNTNILFRYEKWDRLNQFLRTNLLFYLAKNECPNE